MADLPSAYAVLLARDEADLGVPGHRLEDLRGEWTSSELSLDDDVRVAVDPAGEVVGWAAVRHEGAFAAVAPAAEGRGAGAALLAWVRSRERDLGRRMHRQVIAAANETGAALLRRAGYLHVRSNHLMHRPISGAPDPVAGPATPPVGVSLRALQVDRDGPSVHALDSVAFVTDAGYEPESWASFRDEHLGGDELDPGLSLVAVTGPAGGAASGSIVGFLLARRREPELVGFIDILAVAPEAHRRGIGGALLGTALARFAAAGLRAAELEVSSANPPALRLYARHGFTPAHRFDIYEQPA